METSLGKIYQVREITRFSQDINAARQARVDFSNKERWKEIKENLYGDGTEADRFLDLGHPVEGKYGSGDIIQRLDAVMKGDGFKLPQNYSPLVLLDYDLTAGQSQIPLDSEKIKQVSKATKLSNFTARLAVRESFFNQNSERASVAMDKSDIMVQFVYGWDSSRHAAQRWPLRLLNEIYLQTGKEAVAVIIDDPGQYESQLAYVDDIKTDKSMAGLHQMAMATEMFLSLYGLSPREHHKIMRVGHSRGAAKNIKYYFGEPDTANFALAPVWGHDGYKATQAQFLLGLGSEIVGAINDRDWTTLQKISQKIVSQVTAKYVGQEQKSLVALHNFVYEHTTPWVSAAFIKRLYEYRTDQFTRLQDQNIDPDLNRIYQFKSDPFVNHDRLSAEISQALHNNRLQLLLPGDHYGFAADEVGLPRHNYSNSEIILNDMLVAAKTLLA